MGLGQEEGQAGRRLRLESSRVRIAPVHVYSLLASSCGGESFPAGQSPRGEEWLEPGGYTGRVQDDQD